MVEVDEKMLREAELCVTPGHLIKSTGVSMKEAEERLSKFKNAVKGASASQLLGLNYPIVILDEGLQIEPMGPNMMKIKKPKARIKNIFLGIYNFLCWVDSKNQRPKICGPVIKVRPTPKWLSSLSDYFYKLSK